MLQESKMFIFLVNDGVQVSIRLYGIVFGFMVHIYIYVCVLNKYIYIYIYIYINIYICILVKNFGK
jgi:hypothetical protein